LQTKITFEMLNCIWIRSTFSWSECTERKLKYLQYLLKPKLNILEIVHKSIWPWFSQTITWKLLKALDNRKLSSEKNWQDKLERLTHKRFSFKMWSYSQEGRRITLHLYRSFFFNTILLHSLKASPLKYDSNSRITI
jgi:hypothetical protein